MSTVFFEGKTLPASLRRMNGYGDGAADSLNAVANIVKSASPWDLLTGLFVTKPAQAEEAQLQAQEIQAQAIAQQQANQATMVKWLIVGGVGIAAVFGLVLATKPRKVAVGHYKRHRRNRR